MSASFYKLLAKKSPFTYKTIRYQNFLGDDMELFKNDCITKDILRRGRYARDELKLLTILFSFMPVRRIALDVGSNIGNHCAVFGRYFQETHAIEPHQEVFSVLSNNIARNGWKAKAYNIGFSDHDGKLPIYIDERGNFGATSFISNQNGRSYEVEVTTGDAFVKKYISEPVDYIKLDVESFEGPVIKGLATTIKTFQPIISMEWNSQTTIDYFMQNNIFTQELNQYHCLAMYPRWHRSLWPGFFGKIRRMVNKITTRKNCRYYVSEFNMHQTSEAVILIPPKHEDIITPLLEATADH